MPKYVYWFRELADLNEDWVKNINYGKLFVAGFPIPSGFVVSEFVKEEIKKRVCMDDLSQISPTSIPEMVRKDIVDAYFRLNRNYDYGSLSGSTRELVEFGRESNSVLVMCKGKAYPNIRGTGELLEAVLKCFAFGTGPVIVQQMIAPEKAGLAYSNRNNGVEIEATFGFAAPIITGQVEPDVYNVFKDGRINNKRLGSKRFAMYTNKYNRTIESLDISRERSESFALNEKEIEVICKLAVKLEEFLKVPQKITWGIEGRRVYLLNSEPLSEAGSASEFIVSEAKTIDFEAPKEEVKEFTFDKPEKKWDEFDFGEPKVESKPEFNEFAGAVDLFDTPKEQDFSFSKPVSQPVPQQDFSFSKPTPQFNAPTPQQDFSFSNPTPPFNTPPPDFSFSKELPKPEPVQRSPYYDFESQDPWKKQELPKPIVSNLKTGLIISSSTAARTIAQSNTQFVLVPFENVLKNSEFKPEQLTYDPQFVLSGVSRLLYETVSLLGTKKVIVRLSDGRASSGMLGIRGVRRIGSKELDLEVSAISRILSYASDLSVALPFVMSVDDVLKAKELFRNKGANIKVGVVVETPAAVSIVDKLAEQASFVLVDINHLAELMLAVDKNDLKMSQFYNVAHEAILNALSGVIKICKGKGVPVYVCGDAVQNPEIRKLLDEKGADIVFESESLNKPDASLLTW